MEDEERAAIVLYWIPLGAGGNGFVRNNGRMYEALRARIERRTPMDLVHSALEVTVDAERYTIENGWPSPDAHTSTRGVVVEGPVGSLWAGRFRPFRYEIRRWRDGIIPDIAEAIGGPLVLATDPVLARTILALVPEVPPLIWGRKPSGSSEMWNSNSVIAWLLARSGFAGTGAHLPEGTRAPGWQTGVEIARAAEARRTPR